MEEITVRQITHTRNGKSRIDGVAVYVGHTCAGYFAGVEKITEADKEKSIKSYIAIETTNAAIGAAADLARLTEMLEEEAKMDKNDEKGTATVRARTFLALGRLSNLLTKFSVDHDINALHEKLQRG